MIYRIAPNEWLKKTSNMTTAEKQDLSKRIGAWLGREAKVLLPKADEPSARMMSVEQVCGGWTTDAQNAFNEGVRLLTPFVGVADTWLPTMIYVKAAKRSIYRMINILTYCLPRLGVTPKPVPDAEPAPQSCNRKDAEPQSHTTAQLQPVSMDLNIAVPRPKHIDQYIHLLSKETQKRAAEYGQLTKDLGTARSNMRLLLDDSKATATERERWAKTAVALDQKIGDLRKELDTEWSKLTAQKRVSVDVFGVAHILDDKEKELELGHKVSAKKNRKGEQLSKTSKKKSGPNKQPTEEERAARIKYLQKWLRDPRPAATPEHKKKWQDNAMELIKLGAELSESIKKTGAFYKIKIPK